MVIKNKDAIDNIEKYKKGEIGGAKIATDAAVDVGMGLGGMAAGAWTGAAVGSAFPVVGTVAGAVVGLVVGIGYTATTEGFKIYGKTIKDWIKYALYH